MIAEVFKAGYIQQFKDYLEKKNIPNNIVPYESANRLDNIITMKVC
jgi:hypothetical protein